MRPNDPPIHPDEQRASSDVRARRRRVRRGVALVLVLISLATASVLTAFYLTVQDNSAAIGANAQQAAASEWASKSGAALGVAALQTTLDLDTLSPQGVIAEELAISGGAVSVFVTDIEGQPAEEADTDLVITSVASIDGVTSITQRLVTRMPNVSIEESIDPMLGEFGVYATGRLTVEADATIGVWPLSPRSGGMAKIGGQYTLLSDVVIDGGATVNRSGFYVDESANASLHDVMDTGGFAGGAAVPALPPAASPSKPSEIATLSVVMSSSYQPGNDGGEDGDEDEDSDGQPDGIDLTPGRYEEVEARGAVLDLGDPSDPTASTFYSLKRLRLEQGSVARINGDVTIEIRDDLTLIEGSGVTLASPESRVRFFIDKAVLVDNSGVGVPETVAADIARAPEDLTQYVDPRRVRIFSSLPSEGGDQSIAVTMRDGSLVIADVHTPGAVARVESGADLMGRVTAEKVEIRSGSSLLIDPALDPMTGFTNLDGPLYDPMTGELVAGLEAALDSFNASLGAEALLPHVQASVDTTAGASSSGLGGGGVSPRSESRLIDRSWPKSAMSLEGYNETTTTTLDGLRVVPDFDAIYDFSGGAGGGGGGGGGNTVEESLHNIVSVWEVQ